MIYNHRKGPARTLLAVPCGRYLKCRQPALRSPIEEGLLDDTLNWLLLDCTVVAVQETDDVADEVAMTTLFASIKASWKL